MISLAELYANKISCQSVKNRDGMEADRVVMVDVRPALLLPVRRKQCGIHVQNDVLWWLALVRKPQKVPI